MIELERQKTGKLSNPYEVHLPEEWWEKKELVAKFNASPWDSGIDKTQYLKCVLAYMERKM